MLSPALDDLLREHGIHLVVVDERSPGEPFAAQFNRQLTDVQDQAARVLIDHDFGVFVAPPGYGIEEAACSAVLESLTSEV